MRQALISRDPQQAAEQDLNTRAGLYWGLDGNLITPKPPIGHLGHMGGMGSMGDTSDDTGGPPADDSSGPPAASTDFVWWNPITWISSYAAGVQADIQGAEGAANSAAQAAQTAMLVGGGVLALYLLTRKSGSKRKKSKRSS